MNSRLCKRLGIEVPLFAFSHCRDVVAEVSKAGGFGVLGAAGHTPESLEIELGLRGIPYKPKAELLVFYKEKQLETRYIPDFMVFDKVVVELKAVVKMVAVGGEENDEQACRRGMNAPTWHR